MSVTLNEYLKNNHENTILLAGGFGNYLCGDMICDGLALAGINSRFIVMGDELNDETFDGISIVSVDCSEISEIDYAPHTIVILNVSAYPQKRNVSYFDLLDDLKYLLEMQGTEDRLFINSEYLFVMTANDIQTESQVVEFNYASEVENGTCYKDGYLCYISESEERRIIARDELIVPGNRNSIAYVAAAAVISDYLSEKQVQTVLKSYDGNRMEYELIGELNGGRVWGNAGAYMPSHASNCLLPFEEKVIMVTGGNISLEKPMPFNGLALMLNSYVKELILIGDSADKIEQAVIQLKKYDPEELSIHKTVTFKEVSDILCDRVSAGDNVLFALTTSQDGGKDCQMIYDKFTELIG